MNADQIITFMVDNNVKLCLYSMDGFFLSFDGVIENHPDFDEFSCTIDIDPEMVPNIRIYNVRDLFNHGVIFTLYRNGKRVLQFSKYDKN